jgi:hypothetical protein
MTRPPLPDPPHKGGCLCGSVRYSYNARPLGLNACHCSDCKKLSGGGFASVVLGDRAQFTHAGAIARWRKRGDSGRSIDIVRCVECGARMWHEPVEAPQLVFIQAGTLDDATWFLPASHIYASRAWPAAHFAPDALKLPGPPDSREVVLAAFRRLYPD